MRIGIDARFLTHPQHGGFKTYTENLVTALAAADSPHSFFAYTDRDAPLAHLERQRFNVLPLRGDWPLLGMPWREQVGLPLQAARDRLDLLHAPAQTAPLFPGCPLVVTIHDTFSLAGHRYPGRPPAARDILLSQYQCRVGRRAGLRAAHILTVSEASKRELVRELGVDPAHITVTYEAPAPLYRPVDREQAAAEVCRRFALRPPFLLHLGSPDGRKNTQTLLLALQHLATAPKVGLAIAGPCPPNGDHAAGAVPVCRLGPVSDVELVHLYNAATVFVFPSLEEGFGLPVLEAMACGTPVVASDSSAIAEVVGDAALLVPATDPAALARAIERVLTDAPLRQGLARRGLARAARYSWRTCAEETLDVYERVLAVPR